MLCWGKKTGAEPPPEPQPRPRQAGLPAAERPRPRRPPADRLVSQLLHPVELLLHGGGRSPRPPARHPLLLRRRRTTGPARPGLPPPPPPCPHRNLPPLPAPPTPSRVRMGGNSRVPGRGGAAGEPGCRSSGSAKVAPPPTPLSGARSVAASGVVAGPGSVRGGERTAPTPTPVPLPPAALPLSVPQDYRSRLPLRYSRRFLGGAVQPFLSHWTLWERTSPRTNRYRAAAGRPAEVAQ